VQESRNPSFLWGAKMPLTSDLVLWEQPTGVPPAPAVWLSLMFHEGIKPLTPPFTIGGNIFLEWKILYMYLNKIYNILCIYINPVFITTNNKYYIQYI